MPTLQRTQTMGALAGFTSGGLLSKEDDDLDEDTRSSLLLTLVGTAFAVSRIVRPRPTRNTLFLTFLCELLADWRG